MIVPFLPGGLHHSQIATLILFALARLLVVKIHMLANVVGVILLTVIMIGAGAINRVTILIDGQTIDRLRVAP
jgi:hypothetical protein